MVENVVTVMQNVIEQTVVGFTAQVGKRLLQTDRRKDDLAYKNLC